MTQVIRGISVYTEHPGSVCVCVCVGGVMSVFLYALPLNIIRLWIIWVYYVMYTHKYD